MNRIKDIRVEDLYCVVEPGVIYDKLNAALAKHGFWFPTTPGSGEACTIGGMVVTNASGMRAIKYGATRDYVLGLEVVMPTGEVIHTGTRTLKNSSGYQIDRLMVGSEGTLGIVTEITLKLAFKPKASAMTLAAFNSLEDAGKCVSGIIAKPLMPSAIELMDSVCIKAVNKCMNVGLPDVAAICMIEVDGHPVAVDEELRIGRGYRAEVRRGHHRGVEGQEEDRLLDLREEGHHAVAEQVRREVRLGRPRGRHVRAHLEDTRGGGRVPEDSR